MIPAVNHPTDRPNYTEVSLGDLTIAYSYRTPVAFHVRGWGYTARVNTWGPTTGRHLSYFLPQDFPKSDRLPGEQFLSALRAALFDAHEAAVADLRAEGVRETDGAALRAMMAEAGR